MFDRKQVKLTARAHLRRAHWWVVLIVLLTFMMGGAIGSGLGGGITSSSPLYPDGLDQLDNVAAPDEVWDTPEQVINGLKAMFNKTVGDIKAHPIFWVSVAVAALISSFALVLFVCNLITVGAHRWLSRYWLGETPSVASLFDPWHHYRRVMPAMALRTVYLTLWSLLIVPGIVKSYAYSMVPYLIGENPELSPREALTLSQKITHGHKLQLFELDLSFFGWLLLSAITGNIVGILYAYPYIGVTHAGVYHQLKEQAVRSGQLTPKK